jgi:predicted ArsR family transcriptional regulator
LELGHNSLDGDGLMRTEDFVTSDLTLLDLLRERGAMTVAELAAELDVTATAVRQRLNRLMAHQYIERTATKKGRGRPKHHYRLTEKGIRKAGSNFADLAVALWQEIRGIEDLQVRKGLLQRVAKRLAVMYADKFDGRSLEQRLLALTDLFAERRVPVDIEPGEALPVIKATACPYPDLADGDRSICAMERFLVAELLGTPVRLAACRQDGDTSCTFELN